jgi:hypothetical protein
MIARSRSRVSPATEGSIYWLSESRQRRPSDGDENSQEGGKTGKIWDGAGAILGIPHAGTDAHRRHPVCRKRARPSLASRMPERSHAKRRGGVRLREPRCTATSGPRGSGWGANGGSSAPPIPITVIPVAATEARRSEAQVIPTPPNKMRADSKKESARTRSFLTARPCAGQHEPLADG